MLKNFILALTICLLFTGCSQVPKPVSQPFSTQRKLQASQHWNIIAEDIGRDIVAKLSTEYNVTPTITFLANDNSDFCRGMRSFLGTYLINNGITPEMAEQAEYTLDWSVQVVQHKADRSTSDFPAPRATLAASLGYGVYRLFEHSTGAGVIASAVIADAADQIYHLTTVSLPANEIILNITLKRQHLFLYRSTNIYYVNDLDVDQYHTTKDHLGMDKPFTPKTFNVSD